MGDLERYDDGQPEFPRWLRRQWNREHAEALINEHKRAVIKELRAAHAAKMHKWAKGWLMESARDTAESIERSEDNPALKQALLEEWDRWRRQMGGELDS
jgi:hypothetical protein